MMTVTIGGKKIDYYNDIEVSLHYDSVASTFGLHFFYDPTNADHRYLMKPGANHNVTIEYGGELLITGVALNCDFESGAQKSMASISGYSITGVLEDCEIPVSAYPLQSNNLSLKEITERCLKPFKLNLIVDPLVADKCNVVYGSSTASDTQTIKAYISELASHKHVVLSHDEKGNVLLSLAKASQQPICHFTQGGIPVIKKKLSFDGQGMHSDITLQKHATKTGKGNTSQSTIKNPYVPTYRPKTSRQTSGNDVDTSFTVRDSLSDELRNITLTIDLDRWDLNGKIIRPNQIVLVTDEEVYLDKPTKWFIQSVSFKGDNNAETATLTCMLPDVFTADTPKNIFG